VAGVWPERARLNFEGSPDLFRVLSRAEESPQGAFAPVLALLREGVTVAEVESELASLASGLEDSPENTLPAVHPPYGLLGEAYVRGLWLVFAGGLVLLLVAVVNAANLMLGRVAMRSGEIGVRLAMGGSRLRIARLLLTETTLLAGAGIVLAAAVAAGVGAVFEAVEPGRLVPAGAAGLQTRMLGFAALLAAVAAVTCGVVPLCAVRAHGLRTLVSAAGGGRWTATSTRLRGVLVAMQAALAVLLAAGASLMARSFTELAAVDSGMDLDRIAVVAVRAPEHRYASDEAQRLFADRVREAVASIPGVTAVTMATTPPLSGSIRGGLPYLDGEAEPVLAGPEFTSTSSAPESYFRVLGIPVVAGREFEPGERGVVIVNEAFARGRGNVVGRTLRFPRDTMSWTIVGVAGDVRALGLSDDANRVQLYYPHDGGGSYTRFVLRTDGSPAAALAAARERIAAVDADVPLREATTGPMLLREQTARVRFVASLLAGFALAGLLLAVSGVYGAVSLDISRRTREMGVRLALGASRRRVMARVLQVGMRPVLAGALIGVALTLMVAPWLESLLFEIPARDPWSTTAAVVMLAVTAGFGCLVPARRAARVDPAIALRSE
jgi:predicted permease